MTERGWVYTIFASILLAFIGVWLRCRDWSGKKHPPCQDDDMFSIGWLMGDADEED